MPLDAYPPAPTFPAWLVNLISSASLVIIYQATVGRIDAWIGVSLLLMVTALGAIQVLGGAVLLTLEIVTPFVLIRAQRKSQGAAPSLSSDVRRRLIQSWASDALIVASGLICLWPCSQLIWSTSSD